MSYYIYILKCADDSLYTGYAADLDKRLDEHNGRDKSKLGAKYTRGRRPVKIVYSEKFETKSEAMKREAAIKKLTRLKKEDLISGS